MRILFFCIAFIVFQSSTVAQAYLDNEQQALHNLCKEQKTDSTCQNVLQHLSTIRTILKDTSLSNEYIDNVNRNLYYNLKKLHAKDSAEFANAQHNFALIESYLNALSANKEKTFFKTYEKLKVLSISNYIKDTEQFHAFIQNLATEQDYLFLSNYNKFENTALKEKLLLQIAKDNPILLKRYFGSNNNIRNTILGTQNDTINLIYAIYKQSSTLSNAFYLLQKIADKELSIQQADSIGKNDNYLFKTLIEISKKENPLAQKSVNDKLSYLSTLIIRPINAAFEQHESTARFQPLEKYNAEELYTIMVYSQEEIFTSSFEGIYHLFLKKLKEQKIDGYTFLEQINFNEFRTFIKMCAGYGRLPSFLNTMSVANKELLIQKFMYLQHNASLLKNAVSIADALGSIEDKNLMAYIEKELIGNYQKATNEKVKLAFGLLINLYLPKADVLKNDYAEIANKHQMPSLSGINSAALFGKKNIHTQVHLFYNDEDGITSFATFLQTFKTPNWKIEDKASYVKISTTNGKTINIYANKAQEEKAGMQAIENILAQNNTEVEVLVHRGHSFYVNTSLEKLHEETKIVLLGSCGGYHQILNILEKAPNAQIIATKQVGSYTVNNPLILNLAEWIRQGKEIVWENFWENLSTTINTNAYAKDKLKEYIPPHKNLGAAFIKAYKMYE